MAAYGCSGCGVDWPNVAAYQSCPLCGERATYSAFKSPDLAKDDVPEYVRDIKARREAAELARGDASPAHQNRVDRYLALGFSEVDAQVLAVATTTHTDSTGRKWVRAVNHLHVARALASGCTHAQAVRIFA